MNLKLTGSDMSVSIMRSTHSRYSYLDFLFSFDELSIQINKGITVQKMKFSIMDFFSKCDQIRMKLGIWPHLLKKSIMESFIFYAVNMQATLDQKLCTNNVVFCFVL